MNNTYANLGFEYVPLSEAVTFYNEATCKCGKCKACKERDAKKKECNCGKCPECKKREAEKEKNKKPSAKTEAAAYTDDLFDEACKSAGTSKSESCGKACGSSKTEACGTAKSESCDKGSCKKKTAKNEAAFAEWMAFLTEATSKKKECNCGKCPECKERAKKEKSNNKK